VQHDLVIRAGTVHDGLGSDPRTADVAVDGDRIVEVGRVEGRGRAEIDAAGALVTPGFVDVHTHYDGQATWDSFLAPSSWHGVTTVVMGNCGVGFAPVRPTDHDLLISLMEGVEDIPGAALHEGLSWEWETFADYLDAVARRPHDIDVGAQVPHGAVRLYAMGERGARRDPATPEDIDAMAAIVGAAVEAGGLGFTTSRTINHRTAAGEPTPTLTAEVRELAGIAGALAEAGAGVLQVVSDFRDVEDEFGIVTAMARAAGRPVSISIAQADRRPQQYRRMLDLIARANAAGTPMLGQVASRAIGLMLGLQCTLNPFMTNPVYREVAALPLDERVRILRDPAFKARVLQADGERKDRSKVGGRVISQFDRMFQLGDPPDYEPDPSTSVAARAQRMGISAEELAYDLMLGHDGRELLYLPTLNYVDGTLDSTREMLLDPFAIPGLSDGGAHCGTICDSSFPTTLLAHWGKDRSRGARIELPELVRRQTSVTAAALGMRDRGVVAPGYLADLNVIDFDRLRLLPPEMAYDLPAGGKRLLQRAEGYVHTVKRGREIYRDGAPTGALPGQLVRGAQPAPA
jgi:N-acyl-D-aspartate/D-glutamate deacylase